MLKRESIPGRELADLVQSKNLVVVAQRNVLAQECLRFVTQGNVPQGNVIYVRVDNTLSPILSEGNLISKVS